MANKITLYYPPRTDLGPYKEGYKAWEDQIDIGDNPYNKRTQYESYKDWEDGWIDAQFDNLGTYER